ncbi:type II toxin-antitoxin system HipA family toxin [Methylobacterium segetis]|uniref:type II toxin-antitoxin system HipA family toxin n=1 Tax=Methylobacterium segetis TaxID=2488750 RepID=UPI00104C67FD|nr:type II toxin-antitoxin system HipA family toxin [Methylobacterium segetis]
MTSEPRTDEAYVWIWLSGATAPVVAGRLSREGETIEFTYGRSYLERDDAIAIYEPELPLRRGIQAPQPGLSMASCIRDAAPDAWGRRVIVNRRFGQKRGDIDLGQLGELTYLLESGSDRIGALDFQRSAHVYEPREARAASLEELLAAADRVDKGLALPPDLDQALFHGSSLGGARPKAMIREGDAKFIAKFSASSDVFNVVKSEFVAMRLAHRVGLEVAQVQLHEAAGRDVILVRRFDRTASDGRWLRTPMVSALTLFGLDEMMARYASYEDLCTIVRHRFEAPRATLRELFGRLVFNILVGNTDDHARNHAAFWNGASLALTPAYDICPQGRSGNEASQAMLITGSDRRSQMAVCRHAAANFLLSEDEADAVIVAQVETIQAAWDEVCREADLSDVERAAMWRRQILNPYAFQDLPPHLAALGA